MSCESAVRRINAKLSLPLAATTVPTSLNAEADRAASTGFGEAGGIGAGAAGADATGAVGTTDAIGAGITASSDEGHHHRAAGPATSTVASHRSQRVRVVTEAGMSGECGVKWPERLVVNPMRQKMTNG